MTYWKLTKPPLTRRAVSRSTWLALALASIILAGCGGKADRPPATVTGPPSSTQNAPSAPEPIRPPGDAGDSSSDMPNDVVENMSDPDRIFTRTIDEINEDSPLDDIRFDFDSADLSPQARRTLESHAEWLGRYETVTLMVAGHCDERGTVEYNLALGERRAMSAFNYLVSLGIDASRLRTISFGKEIPLDSASTEEAWARNRRGHFEITGR